MTQLECVIFEFAEGTIMMAENRRYPRTESDTDTLYYIEDSTDLGNERMYYPGHVRDTSQAGLGLVTHTTHLIDQHIWLEAPSLQRKAVEARIRWINACENDDQYHIGVELISLP